MSHELIERWRERGYPDDGSVRIVDLQVDWPLIIRIRQHDGTLMETYSFEWGMDGMPTLQLEEQR